ncbi:TIGR02594 family protein [Spartinivicinus ruber]|uniref:TIGR02594 family protein n=1 Tax=Spartinivicinus ruber TaxID=2683272 RepID=UPI0013D88986|nr:TIGR02594 family protein [Spartinivicinus ruber]
MMNTIYRVQSGDTLTKIARVHCLSLKELLAINPQIANPDFIDIGQPINIPINEQDAEKDLSIEISDSSLPKWYLVARKEMEVGVEEIRGAEHNPRIIEYHQSTTLKASDDETAWCSSFVNWCIEISGITGTKSAAARSWLQWGKALPEPTEGCVVVFKRGSKPWQGHVGFYVGINGSHILVLGGNQCNEVNISSYPKGRLLGFRWPNV